MVIYMECFMVKYTWAYMNLVDDILKDKLFDFLY